jgi:hypothetical protein
MYRVWNCSPLRSGVTGAVFAGADGEAALGIAIPGIPAIDAAGAAAVGEVPGATVPGPSPIPQPATARAIAAPRPISQVIREVTY